MKLNKISTALCGVILGMTVLIGVPTYGGVSLSDYCDDPENIYVPENPKPSKPEKPVPPEASQPDKPVEKIVEHIPYIKGYEDSTFRAERSVTREEIATMIARLLLDGEEPEDNTSFEDINTSRYSNKYVGYLEKLGVVSGYEDGKFRPFDAVTRGELAHMIAKVEDLKKVEPKTYSDVESSHWAAGEIEAVTAAGYMNGYNAGNENTFEADQYLTRAEAVTSLNKVFNRICNDSTIPNMFSDLESSYWAYQDILFAAVKHEHKLK